jgi:hypothetical protein
MLKDLKQIAELGLGLLGGSITLRILRSLSDTKTIGKRRVLINYKIKQREIIS